MVKDYQYYYSQLRRIEDHREAQAEKEIRKIYRQILKETRHFIADEYAALAEDGKLTYDILRAKGQDARFLQEVEQRLGDMSIDVSRQIKKTVEEMYQLSFDGLREAVEKSKDVEEFREIFGGMDRGKAQQLWATVDNTIMDIALEKNHKNIIWDIKREIATALTAGDRFDTMADRLAKSLDGNYKKATLIARTEVHRVREAAHSASAKDLNETLKKGNSGLRYVKKWKTMKDGAVRPNVRYKTKKGWKSGKSRPGAPDHVKMHNVVVLEEEQFDLGGGVMTDAPGQSGVAGHDCNCRCQCLHLLMDDQEFFEATGRHFPGHSKISVADIRKRLTTVDENGNIYYQKSNGFSIDLQFFANKGIQKQTDKQLAKSIASWNETVILHQDKVNNPWKYDKGWNEKDDRQKTGLIKFWEREIRTAKRNIDEANAELAKRGSK